MVLRIGLTIEGMDCQSCAADVQDALLRVPGVREASVRLAPPLANVAFEPDEVSPEWLCSAVRQAGFRALVANDSAPQAVKLPGLHLFGLVAGAVGGLIALEHFGWLDRLTDHVPLWLKAAAVVAAGWKPLLGVLRDMRGLRITSHTLLTIGVAGAAAAGEWATALILLLLLHLATVLETLTIRRGRQAVAHLLSLQPEFARRWQDGVEVEVAASSLCVGDIVAVRPGERTAVDGEVVEGAASLDESSLTGESLPRDKHAGDLVFAGTIAVDGYLRVRAERVGTETAFARIGRLVESAESQKAPVQRIADRFAAAFLPVVLVVSAAASLASGSLVPAVSVLVVACACAVSLATPMVVLAVVGRAASNGILIKGGAVLESLARVDTVVIDKTGTLTEGKPEVTELRTCPGFDRGTVLAALAALEGRSEHPLATALVRFAESEPGEREAVKDFRIQPGRGVRGRVADTEWHIGNARLLEEAGVVIDAGMEPFAKELQSRGDTVVYASAGGRLAAVGGLRDRMRAGVPQAILELRLLGIRRIEILTGDSKGAAGELAERLGLTVRAGLLPEDKIAYVRDLQSGGATVMMVGDGVNDAPALARAEVGVAMGVMGTHLAIETAGVALLRDDWSAVPESLRLGKLASRTIRQNLGFTLAYNVIGIAAAALGLLPPVWAAAAHNLPDVVILINSSRLLRDNRRGGGVGAARPSASAAGKPSPVRGRPRAIAPRQQHPAAHERVHVHTHDHEACQHSHCHHH